MTTTATSNQVTDNSTLTNFKAWAQAISNALSAFGWTLTSDTGQVNWSTIVSVPSSTYVYEVWQAADSAAGTLPIVMKIGYGSSTSAVQLQITVGTGSNGSGTITGGVITSPPWQVNVATANGGGTTFPCYFSGNAGEFRAYMWQGSTSALVFGVERSKDSSGAVTTSYFTVLAYQNSNQNVGCWQQSILSASLVAPQEHGLVTTGLSTLSGSGSFNGTVAAFPVFPSIGSCGNPMLGFMSCCANDVADGATISVLSMYGSTHTYIAIKGTTFGTVFGGHALSGTPSALLMRYE